ncbi:uncharacterized protein EI97DRAFT_371657 [Westerdykella ornata]|uniref:Rhodopsin domain-containing protein n=1 Tax=Westerdykella ornata TaxID=318751 RepID=A0A6A6JR47_WESOR|nr:uncharacterized protein EI97DRAFT_371657 [Westerdykella ornata]KAF2279120.1 hypothetical protein EI97DRAFT_371657 [Westerdykella ornata]
MLVALVAIVGRVYIRVFVLRLLRLDDYFILVAMMLSILGCSFFLQVVSLGMGKHIFAIPAENIQPLLMWIFIVSVLIPMALCFVKLSIAFFLLSLTRGTRYGRFCWFIIGFLVAFMLFTFFSLIFGCVPIAANWDFTLRPPPIGTGNAKCMEITTYRNIAVTNSVINIVTDIVLALMPVPLVWRLQVNKRTKISLVLILGLGFVACAAGIVKTPLLFHFFDDFDSTGNRSWYYAWQMIEMNVAILAATLPSLKPAFRWLLDTARTFASGVASGNRTRTGGTPAHIGYKRQFSSGYLHHRDARRDSYQFESNPVRMSRFIPKNDIIHDGSRGNSNNGYTVDGVELEPMYNVTVSGMGAEKKRGGNGSPSSGSGMGSNASSDAILQIEDVDGQGMGPGPAMGVSGGTVIGVGTGPVPAPGPGERGIFCTTEVTVVSC